MGWLYMGFEVLCWAATPKPWQLHTHLLDEQSGGTKHLGGQAASSPAVDLNEHIRWRRSMYYRLLR